MKTLRHYQKTACNEAIEHFKKSAEPILLEASVGAGKTLMIAHVARNTLEKGGQVIVLAHQTELIKQNSDEAWDYFPRGVNFPMPSMMAGSLNSYGTKNPIFAMRKTLQNRLHLPDLWARRTDLLIVDEAHMFDFQNEESTAGKIYKHLNEANERWAEANTDKKPPKLRVLGLTGTPYRGTTPVYGKDKFFTAKIEMEISTEYLTEQGFLVEAHYGLHDHGEELDFSGLDIRHNEETGGNYSEEDFDRILQGEYQKTMQICAEVHQKAQKMDNGCLIFCGSKLHTEQVKLGLINAGANPDTIAIVTDNTNDKDREAARLGAISGDIKYFVNVGVASTGWNVPSWEYLVYLRPIGSLTFFLQSKGRVLRPFLDVSVVAEFNAEETTLERRKEILAASKKPYAVVDDYAGVMEAMAPYLDSDMNFEEAKLERAKKEGETKICPICEFENGAYAQRCINHHTLFSLTPSRCLHYWQFNECRDPSCKDELGRRTQNAVTAKTCRICDKIMLDPNKALLRRVYRDDEYREVDRMEIKLDRSEKGIIVYFHLKEHDPDLGTPYLNFNLDHPTSKRAYQNFVKTYVVGTEWRSRVIHGPAKKIISNAAVFNTPTQITVRKNEKNKYIIGKRIFRSGRESTDEQQKQNNTEFS